MKKLFLILFIVIVSGSILNAMEDKNIPNILTLKQRNSSVTKQLSDPDEDNWSDFPDETDEELQEKLSNAPTSKSIVIIPSRLNINFHPDEPDYVELNNVQIQETSDKPGTYELALEESQLHPLWEKIRNDKNLLRRVLGKTQQQVRIKFIGGKGFQEETDENPTELATIVVNQVISNDGETTTLKVTELNPLFEALKDRGALFASFKDFDERMQQEFERTDPFKAGLEAGKAKGFDQYMEAEQRKSFIQRHRVLSLSAAILLGAVGYKSAELAFMWWRSTRN